MKAYRDENGLPRVGVPTKRIRHCKSCGEPMHKLIVIGTNTWAGSWQCLNRSCKQYGIAW